MADLDKHDFDILVAKCGRAVGLKGEIRLNIYSDFSEIFSKGNVFLARGLGKYKYSKTHPLTPSAREGENIISSGLSPTYFFAKQKSKQKNDSCDSTLESRRNASAKKRIQGRSSASADFLLEAEKRGSPPKSGVACERSEAKKAAAFWHVGGAGRGVQPFLREKTSESKNQNNAESAEDSRDFGTILTLESFHARRSIAKFREICDIDSAKKLTNALLYSTKDLSQKYCALGENEHFWFDIVGLCVVDNGMILGEVSEIERIGNVDYLIVAVDSRIHTKFPHIKAKKFYLPYIPRYILGVEGKSIVTRDALGVLEES